MPVQQRGACRIGDIKNRDLHPLEETRQFIRIEDMVEGTVCRRFLVPFRFRFGGDDPERDDLAPLRGANWFAAKRTDGG